MGKTEAKKKKKMNKKGSNYYVGMETIEAEDKHLYIFIYTSIRLGVHW